MIIQDVFEPTLKEAMQTLGKGAAVNQNTGVYSINDVTNQIKQGQWGVSYPANDMTTSNAIANGFKTNGFVKTGRLNLNGNFAGYYDLAYWNGNLTINDDNELGAFLDNFFFTGNTDTHSALVYINGDLNIHYPCIIKPAVRKLFTCFYIAGAFTHDGLISMTDRGANHSGTGNSHGYTAPIAIPINGTVTIPATGGAGGARANRTTSGSSYNSGGTATYGTGGGGSGHNHLSLSGNTTAGAGGTGTCFSGGGSGCGTMTYDTSNTITATHDAQPNGGAGGRPYTLGAGAAQYGSSGGVGNPGGFAVGADAGSGFGNNSAWVKQPSNGGFMEQNSIDPWKGIGTERGPGRYVDAGNGTAGVFIAMCEGNYTGTYGRIESRGHNVGNYHEIGGNGSGGGRAGGGGGGIGMVFGGTGTRTGPTPVVDGGDHGNNYGGGAGGAGTGAIYAL
jgi:hypothetical protein